jgi:hypothetical protein
MRAGCRVPGAGAGAGCYAEVSVGLASSASVSLFGASYSVLSWPAGPGRAPPIQTVLMLQNSRIPWTDSSRP